MPVGPQGLGLGPRQSLLPHATYKLHAHSPVRLPSLILHSLWTLFAACIKALEGHLDISGCRLCHWAAWSGGSGSFRDSTYSSSKRHMKCFGTASKQERLTPQAYILNQFRSNTKEMPNQRAFYFLCFPCNPPNCLPVPGSAAGLKVTSLLSHSGELVLSVLLLMASSSKASYTTHL